MSKALIRRSERIYDMLLKFYPKSYRQEFGEEMKYVFSESLKDIYKERGSEGVITLWGRTFIDTCKSALQEHFENKKGGDIMKNKKSDLIMQNKIFAWLAGAAGLLLLIPYFLTIRDGNVKNVGWNWNDGDYVFAFIMLFGFSSLFVLAARRWKKHRVVLAFIIALAFIYLWAEAAIGIFTNWGN